MRRYIQIGRKGQEKEGSFQITVGGIARVDKVVMEEPMSECVCE